MKPHDLQQISKIGWEMQRKKCLGQKATAKVPDLMQLLRILYKREKKQTLKRNKSNAPFPLQGLIVDLRTIH